MQETDLKILVTGLCLQGNKGGPAIALSLRKQIKSRLPNCKMTFVVPGSRDVFARESSWADRYGVRVIEDFQDRDPKSVLNVRFWRRSHVRNDICGLRRYRTWQRELRDSDLLLEMSAISYVGPPINSEEHVEQSPRVRYFRNSVREAIPMIAWTQSYGPFSTDRIRELAREDLRRQTVVFCRGQDSLDKVRRLLPGHQSQSFPDVAVVLDYDREKGRQLILSQFPAHNRPLVTISPSAVVYRRTLQHGISSHVSELQSLIRSLVAEGKSVLLVPHTLRIGKNDPHACDLGVSQLIYQEFAERDDVGLLREDLSALDLKSVIANAQMHVGARYHSIIAALSSGVPCISLSWHHKYKDIMDMYEIGHLVHDSVSTVSTIALSDLTAQVWKHRHDIRTRLLKNHPNVVAEVDRNTDIFCDLVKKAVR